MLAAATGRKSAGICFFYKENASKLRSVYSPQPDASSLTLLDYCVGIFMYDATALERTYRNLLQSMAVM